MAGAALVHSVWATTPAETQKLARRPRTKDARGRAGQIGDASIQTIGLDIDLLARRLGGFQGFGPSAARPSPFFDRVDAVGIEGDVILDPRHRFEWRLVSPHR